MSENFKEEAVDQKYVTLYNDVELLREHLATISNGITQQEVSKYPIFIAYQNEVALGKSIFTKEKNLTNWNISVSILEDLVNKKIVELAKIDHFRKVYKNPEKFFCFLVIDDKDFQFIFIKRGRTVA